MENKALETRIEEQEAQKEVLREVDELLNKWQDWTTEEQSRRRDTLLCHVEILEPRDQKLVLKNLAEGEIISQREAKKFLEEVKINDDGRTKREPEVKYTAFFEGLVDLAEYNGVPVFLVKEGDDITIFTRVKRDGLILIPPPKEQIPWLLPRAEKVIGSYETDTDSKLYDDLVSYHKDISELPSEKYYDLIVAWDFHTYILEGFHYSPIICLFAVPERGKTRTGQGLIYVAYRGIHVESLREAYIIRVADNLKATLFFDVKDIWRKAERNNSEDILLQRFEQGAKVPRVLYPERGAHKDMVYYSVFGATIIGTNEGTHRILETRAVQINMPETGKRFENDITPEFALPYKERLVAFRARHLGDSLPNISKPARGRLGDILKSLQQVILLVKPQAESSFLKLVREIEMMRLIEKSDTLEAQILMALISLKEKVISVRLPIKEITDALNYNKLEKYWLNTRTVGRRLSAMGFKKVRAGKKGASAIIWEEVKIGQMKTAYGLKETSETSETSEIPEENTCFRP